MFGSAQLIPPLINYRAGQYEYTRNLRYRETHREPAPNLTLTTAAS